MKKKSINKYLWIAFVFSLTATQAQEILTQNKAVSLALEHNYGIQVEQNNVAISENNTTILNTGYLPTLTANAGANYNLNDTEAVFTSGTVTTLTGAKSSSYNASLNLNYILFDGLGREYNYKKIQEEYQLSELQARETIENTVIQLFSVYYNVAQIKENKKSFEQSLAISKDRLKRAEYQFDYGQNTKLGVLNASVDINNDSIQILNTQMELKNAKRNLNLVLGNVLSESFDINTDVHFILELDKPALLAKAKEKNVALLKAEKNIALKELDVKLVTSEFLPTIGLTGSYGWNKNNNNAASPVLTSTNIGLSGGLNLTWNLFEGKSFVAAKNKKLALQNEKLLQKNILNEIERDFNNAWDNYQNKYTVYQIQEETIKTAQNNFDRTNEKFKLGQVNSIEFRQAQLNLLNAELTRNQAKFQAKYAELEVLYISGDLLNQNF
ncbi:TolC family protein [Wenyingzhuangia aestuarii]|uniref:TolC family protein n=1 Tax=Wenyingzhuangia aestuarii TaxID=1647582 RepID=UPI00143BFA70|nr:TolC family protein [Wenyingzhuangia aestuarii]NJB84154.1 outer membrane protein TolC [Wenyingzhuangia aestuarii]